MCAHLSITHLCFRSNITSDSSEFGLDKHTRLSCLVSLSSFDSEMKDQLLRLFKHESDPRIFSQVQLKINPLLGETEMIRLHMDVGVI